MQKILIIPLLLFTITAHPQHIGQIDSIKLVETISDSLAFVVHSSINGGAFGVGEDWHPAKIEKVEYVEEDNTIKVNILYSQVILADCYCHEQTIIKIKKDVYIKAVVEVKIRGKIGGTEENPEFGDYRHVDIKELDLSSITNIFDNSLGVYKVFIYPNPIQNVFYINLGENKTMNFELYNIQGILLLSKSIITEANVDISFLSSGLYFIVVDKKYVYKIIKH